LLSPSLIYLRMLCLLSQLPFLDYIDPLSSSAYINFLSMLTASGPCDGILRWNSWTSV
jgi:hypothetical protein